MIKLDYITIKDFRGIRDLGLSFENNNFVICGPNGTGKSGIVDAIEFALTGNISRLSGSGTGGISVKDHGPHVDKKTNPENAAITLKVIIAASGKSATIHRTVKNASKPVITPADEDVKKAFEHVALHPEFVLSRRELIKFVLSEPSKRSEAVQALLRLEELETLRKTLQKISNAEARLVPTCETNKKTAIANLMRAMEIQQLNSLEVLAAANTRRIILSLQPLTSFDANTSIKEGLTGLISSETRSPIAKTVTLSDIKAVREQIEEIAGSDYETLCNDANAAIDALQKLSGDGKTVAKVNLLKTALTLFDEEFCPVCETEWEPEKFRRVVDQKLGELDKVTKATDEASRRLNNLIPPLQKLIASLNTLLRPAGQLIPIVDTVAITAYTAATQKNVSQLQRVFPLDDTPALIEKVRMIPAGLSDTIDKIEKAVQLIPEPTQQDDARDYLTIAQERIETYRKASQELKRATDRLKLAKDVYDTYCAVETTELEKIYKDVEQSFIEMYREINADENQFKALLTPSAGKLGFEVDFYGRGYFPPGAYHSEGHQDGMGLCLYLALMNHLLKGNFTFAVLDDVLMSVDSGHRREVTQMLKTKFPHVQFIMTTHDEVWSRTMKFMGLASGNRVVHFRKWTVDSGPVEWDDRDIWQELDDYLAKDDVRAAAALLRHYLEYISKEICQVLRAQVEFRGDAQFTLGDLLPNALKAFSKALKKGKAAAQSWGNKEDENKISILEDTFNKARAATKIDEWQINPAVHYNEWASFHVNDFTPVVTSFKNLLSLLSCSICNMHFYIVPERGDEQSLRCTCQALNVNLVQKPKDKAKAIG